MPSEPTLPANQAPPLQTYERTKEHSAWFTECERIIKEQPGKLLTDEQRRFYFEHGYICVENCVSPEWVARLRTVMDRAVSKAAGLTKEQTDGVEFMVEPHHTKENPRLIRLGQPVNWDETFREFMVNGPMADVAEDLLGPSLRFQGSKLNFKWQGGGDEVHWHQDIQFWPHTNYGPLTIGCYLEDIDETMGPFGVIDRSHLGPLYKQRDPKTGAWTGILSEKDLAEVDVQGMERYFLGKAGTMTVHNCRMIHGSQPNNHPTKARPLLLQTYAPGNALPLGETLSSMRAKKPGTENMIVIGDIIRGEEPDTILYDPRPCPWNPVRRGGTFFASVASGMTMAQPPSAQQAKIEGSLASKSKL